MNVCSPTCTVSGSDSACVDQFQDTRSESVKAPKSHLKGLGIANMKIDIFWLPFKEVDTNILLSHEAPFAMLSPFK